MYYVNTKNYYNIVAMKFPTNITIYSVLMLTIFMTLAYMSK